MPANELDFVIRQALASGETTLPPDEYLSAEEIQELRKEVLAQLASLMEHGQDAVKDLVEEKTMEADSVDVASTETDREFVLRLAGRERVMIHKLQRAIERMGDGEYGVCDTCGNAIGFKRLMARPVATQCVDCKTQAEQLERRSRSL
jgi:DnaK suppressor protein